MKKNLKWVILTFFVMGIVILFFLNTYSKSAKKESAKEETEELIFKEETEENTTKKDDQKENVFVDIKGAIANPGVYELEQNKKVIDVVNLAGGFLENANTQTINLAKKVTNEMVIIIYTNEEIKLAMTEKKSAKVIDNTCVCPVLKNDACINKNETKKDVTTSNEQETTITEPININTASASDFDKLPGIGASKAEAIVQYREKNGPFQKIEDLKEISGIGDALFEKIKDYITV